MSVFGPNQVGEIIIGDAVATETTFATFKTGASDKEIKALSLDGSAPTVGKSFRFYQKAGAASDGYEFSDVINPRYIDRITVSTYLAEVQKSVRVDTFTPVANTTYEVAIRMYNDGGTLSTENFSTIQGFYVTGNSITGITATTIRDGVKLSLQKNIDSRGGGEFVLADVTGPVGFTVTGAAQTNDPARNTGRQIEFDVQGKSFTNTGNAVELSDNTGLILTTVLNGNNPGRGTGKYVSNYEWFTKGNKYEVYRTVGYPADFNTPYYADKAGQYSIVDIVYYEPRKQTSVERQYKVLTVAVKAGLATVVADLETITGYDLANPGTTEVGGLPGPQGIPGV